MARPARRVEVTRLLPVEASVAFAWVADLRTHPRWIPLTRLDGAARPGPEPGDRFTMVSGPGVHRDGLLGRLVVADHMVLEQLERPSTSARRVGRTRLRKRGPVLLGEAGFDVVPVDDTRSRVVWWEEAYLAGPLPRTVTDPLTALALRVLMTTALTRLDRALARRASRPS